MGKGNGSSSEGDDGTDVNTGVAKGNREKSLHIGDTQLRCLTNSKKPHGYKVEATGGHLHGSNSPRVAKDIKSLLIVDIVSNVEKVPQGKVGTDLKGFSQTGFAFTFCGSLGSVGKFQSSFLGTGPGSSGINNNLILN